MKIIFYLFAVFALGSTFAFTPFESEYEEELLIPVLSEEDLTPEQRQCIQNAIEQIITDNPQLDWWFEAVKNSHQRIVKKAEKCKELENPDNQRKCLIAVTIILKAENLRLILRLPIVSCLNIR